VTQADMARGHQLEKKKKETDVIHIEIAASDVPKDQSIWSKFANTCTQHPTTSLIQP